MTDVLLPILNEPTLFIFWCEGCGYCHHVDTTRWKWNGSLSKPTVTPSLLLHEGTSHPRCHLFITDGQIRYLNDCGHDLAGQTVSMTEPLE